MPTNLTKKRVLVSIVTVLIATTVIATPVVGSSDSPIVDRSVGESTKTPASASLLQSATQNQFEPDDDFANATAISSGTYDGLEITQDDTDFYAVDVESDDALSASVQFAHADGNLDLFLINPSQDEVVQVSDTETDNETITYPTTESGTYYLAVVGYQGATAPYNLTVSITGDSPSEAPQTGDLEPNNDFISATQISPGTYTGLEITQNDSLDFYAAELDSGEVLSASIQFAQANGDLDLVLFGPDQNTTLQESTSETDDENITYLAAEPGTYYLAVGGYQNATAPYNLTVSTSGDNPPPVPPTGEFEPNNDFANATQIEPGTYTGLETTRDDSLDFYAANLTSGEALSASIQFAHADGDLNFFLVGPNQNETLQTSISGTDDENITHVATETGTYYLVVAGYQGATAPYNLTFETTSGNNSDPMVPAPGDTTPDVGSNFEPNDDFENASILSPGSYAGFEITDNDIDIYGVELASSERLSASIQFAHADGDLDVLLFDPTQSEELQASTSETDDENITHVATEAGTYYLVVLGYQGAAAPYNLTVGRSRADDETLPTPTSDRLGWENGYWANETIEITQSDGLSEQEREALLARSMARVEEIRGLEFQRNVSYSIITRDEYSQLLNQSESSQNQRLQLSPYYNNVYEATFLVDEETDAYEEAVGETGATVGGFYTTGTDQITLITDDTTRSTIDEGLLIHELVHALQDQYSLTSYSPGATADESTARLGLSEGEANYIMSQYERRCQIDWECIPTPQAVDGGSTDVNPGIALTDYQPYSDGPALVDQLFEEGGWEAVTQAYDNPPVSTEQVIHPERYPDEQLAPLEFTSRPYGDWQLLGTERIGESWIYSMFWYQAREFNISVVDASTLDTPDAGELDTLNYTSTPSEGWGNDQLYMYTNGNQDGYVWQTVWDSERDAEQFESAYLNILSGQGAQQVSENRWVIPEGEPYADAFYVTRNGTTVTIVNAPTTTDLPDISPAVVDERNQTNE